MSLTVNEQLHRLTIENEVMEHLLLIEINRIDISYLCKLMNINKIAVYGCNRVGKLLLEIFDKYKVDCYGIDKCPQKIEINKKIYSSEEKWPDADIFIIAGELYYDEIYKNIKGKSDTNVAKASHFVKELLNVSISYTRKHF